MNKLAFIAALQFVIAEYGLDRPAASYKATAMDSGHTPSLPKRASEITDQRTKIDAPACRLTLSSP